MVEASSEGLAQGRLDGCVFDVAVFTNLTRDHLDFHGTMEAYRDAKGLLFEMLDRPNDKRFPAHGQSSADDPASRHLVARTKTAQVLTYGIDREADFGAFDVRADGYGMRFRLRVKRRNYEAVVPLIGRFNVMNALAAMATAHRQGCRSTRPSKRCRPSRACRDAWRSSTAASRSVSTSTSPRRRRRWRTC